MKGNVQGKQFVENCYPNFLLSNEVIITLISQSTVTSDCGDNDVPDVWMKLLKKEIWIIHKTVGDVVEE